MLSKGFACDFINDRNYCTMWCIRNSTGPANWNSCAVKNLNGECKTK